MSQQVHRTPRALRPGCLGQDWGGGGGRSPQANQRACRFPTAAPAPARAEARQRRRRTPRLAHAWAPPKAHEPNKQGKKARLSHECEMTMRQRRYSTRQRPRGPVGCHLQFGGEVADARPGTRNAERHSLGSLRGSPADAPCGVLTPDGPPASGLLSKILSRSDDSGPQDEAVRGSPCRAPQLAGLCARAGRRPPPVAHQVWGPETELGPGASQRQD